MKQAVVYSEERGYFILSKTLALEWDIPIHYSGSRLQCFNWIKKREIGNGISKS